jgi:hypothetical protein
MFIVFCALDFPQAAADVPALPPQLQDRTGGIDGTTQVQQPCA